VSLTRQGNLNPDDTRGSDRYCLVYRLASLGSGQGSSICIPDKGLEAMHVVFVYINSRFYLENITDLTNVTVNETALSKNELMPLSFGDRIRIARLDLEFCQKKQLYIGN
jgi:hypothetical protein